ncbi:hypothetical protein S40285_10896 [Stachybotrys chlorohalonatus IBT 40285]|uniref:Uncharacterized protein n=1 Tax=Stachybotrys chlorohalonatus (strain IBT 40285) TaxID=1283841 RepID=A0A084QY55_STAC4|nr:hypothetical protein S40285_10896 [Stachybotrys chlorohalonata IBT 40285]
MNAVDIADHLRSNLALAAQRPAGLDTL